MRRRDRARRRREHRYTRSPKEFVAPFRVTFAVPHYNAYDGIDGHSYLTLTTTFTLRWAQHLRRKEDAASEGLCDIDVMDRQGKFIHPFYEGVGAPLPIRAPIDDNEIPF